MWRLRGEVSEEDYTLRAFVRQGYEALPEFFRRSQIFSPPRRGSSE